MRTPTNIKLRKKSKLIEVHFQQQIFELDAEYLRVLSPSAEVRGHGKGQEVLQHGKIHVGISNIEPQGNYGIKIVFDDGHDSGIYTWDYLFELGRNKTQLWSDYLELLDQQGKSRDPDVAIVKFFN